MIAVETRVKGIVQKHSPEIEKRDREGNASNRDHGPPPASHQPGQTIGPDGGKIRDPPQNQERASLDGRDQCSSQSPALQGAEAPVIFRAQLIDHASAL